MGGPHLLLSRGERERYKGWRGEKRNDANGVGEERELERQRQEGGFYAFTVSCSLLPGKNRVDGVSGGMAWVCGAVRGAQHNVCTVRMCV